MTLNLKTCLKTAFTLGFAVRDDRFIDSFTLQNI